MLANLRRTRIVVTCLLITTSLHLFSNRQEEESFVNPVDWEDWNLTNQVNSKPFSKNKTKTILLYTNFYDWADWTFGVGGEEVFEAHNCPVTNCDLKQVTYLANRTEYPDENFDAILFHIRDFGDTFGKDEKIPDQSKRPSDQIYVVMLYESPTYTFQNLSEPRYQGFWNWTMSYRYDTSDIYSPMGWISEGPYDMPGLFPWRHQKPFLTPQRKQFLIENPRFTEEEWKIKNGTVVWLNSHCETFSQREVYAQELGQYVDLDIFGSCGKQHSVGWIPFTCTNCYQELERQYKFYLSFENNICTEYATEKFWNALESNMVPIVLGNANYAAIAPPGSYINVQDYHSPKALADYLNYVSSNKQEYENFFWWRTIYFINTPALHTAGLCGLCRALHENDNPDTAFPRKTVSLKTFWSRDECYYPQDVGLPDNWNNDNATTTTTTGNATKTTGNATKTRRIRLKKNETNIVSNKKRTRFTTIKTKQ